MTVLRFMRYLFVVVCMITGGVLGGMLAPKIEAGLVSLAKMGVPQSQPAPDTVAPSGTTQPDKSEKPAVRKESEKISVGVTGNWDILLQLGCIIAGALLGLLFGTESQRLLSIAQQRVEELEQEELLATVVGIVLGIIITALCLPLLWITGPVFPLLLILTGAAFIYLGITAANRVIGMPFIQGKSPTRRRSVKILDTNIIIDGRIQEIFMSGFLEGQIYIPQFVLDELQFIADSGDPLKRARGRRGLDILNNLKSKANVDTGTHDHLAPEAAESGVDRRLIKLAKAIGGDIVTNDYNLNKVAEFQDVRVLNINDLALAVKPNVLPGEELTVMLIREGKEQNQGIAYLDDGTMVVVEGGSDYLQKTVRVIVTSVLQTTAGKMIFAGIPEGNQEDASSNAQQLRDNPRGRPKRPLR